MSLICCDLNDAYVFDEDYERLFQITDQAVSV